MPRPNRNRTVGSERTLAQRITFERERKRWTYENLAQRMTTVGCPIQKSAIYKIEQGDPPRRVTVDELVALANVFNLSLDELLERPEQVLSRKAKSLIAQWGDARDALGVASTTLEQAEAAVVEFVRANPDSRAAMEAALGDYARILGYPDVDEAAAYWSAKFRGVPAVGER